MALENYSEAARIGLTFAFATMIVTDLIGNTLVCYVVYKHRRMRIAMNYLLVNLAVSDIFVAVFIAPRYLFSQAFSHPGGISGDILCKLITGEIFTWVGALSSVFTLVCIAFERFLAVRYPYNNSKRLTREKLKYVIPAGWLFALAGNIPLFMYVKYVEDFGACLPLWPTEDFAKYHSVIGTFVLGVFPILIMGSLYSNIVHQLWFKQDASSSSVAQQAVLKYRRRSTKMVAIVSLIYCICWIPDFAVYIYVSYSTRPLYNEIHTTAILLVTLNSAINPIIYSFQSERFHKHLMGLVCCKARNEIQPRAVGNSTNTGNQTLSTPADQLNADVVEQDSYRDPDYVE